MQWLGSSFQMAEEPPPHRQWQNTVVGRKRSATTACMCRPERYNTMVDRCNGWVAPSKWPRSPPLTVSGKIQWLGAKVQQLPHACTAPVSLIYLLPGAPAVPALGTNYLKIRVNLSPKWDCASEKELCKTTVDP